MSMHVMNRIHSLSSAEPSQCHSRPVSAAAAAEGGLLAGRSRGAREGRTNAPPAGAAPSLGCAAAWARSRLCLRREGFSAAPATLQSMHDRVWVVETIAMVLTA